MLKEHYFGLLNAFIGFGGPLSSCMTDGQHGVIFPMSFLFSCTLDLFRVRLYILMNVDTFNNELSRILL